MPRLPETISELVRFCALHEAQWREQFDAVGLTLEQVDALKAALVQAREALQRQTQVHLAARAATLVANERVDDLRATAAALLRSITTFAGAQDQAQSADVYARAQIDPARRRTPPAPPGQPTGITAALGVRGEVTLKWKCKNPPGGHVVYVINRRVRAAGSDAFSRARHLGVSGTRAFTDDSIPAGAAAVTYTIRAHRGQTMGPMSAVYTAQFGADPRSPARTFAGARAQSPAQSPAQPPAQSHADPHAKPPPREAA